MGFLSDLFSPEQENSTTVTMPDWIQSQIQSGVNNVAGFSPDDFYQGNWQAELNPMLSGAWNNMYNNPAGQQYMDQVAGAGQMGLQGMQQGMDYMGDLRSGGSPQFQYDQGVFDQTMGNLMPGLQGQFDAGSRDMTRNLEWNQLPGLDMQAAGMGLQGSTKLGQQSALAEGMTQDRIADFGSSLYSNAVNQAQGAAMGAGSQNLSADMNTQGSLLSGYNNYANMGLGAMGDAFNMNQGIMGNQLAAGQGQQGYDQQSIDMMRQQMMFPYEFYQNQLGTMGNIGGLFAGQDSFGGYSPGLGNVALDFAGSLASGGFFNDD